MLTRLDVINNALMSMGESEVSYEDRGHPDLQTLESRIDYYTKVIQSRMLWFNTDYPTLLPQADTGYILIPDDVASVDSLTAYPRLSHRDGRLFNEDEVTDVFERGIKVRIIRVLDFDQMPSSAQIYVGALTKMAYVSIDGGTANINEAKAEVDEAKRAMNEEHIRNAKVNMFMTPGVYNKLQRIRSFMPHRGYYNYGYTDGALGRVQ